MSSAPAMAAFGPARTALAVVGFEQDAAAGQRAGGSDPGADEATQLDALRFGEGNGSGVRHGGACPLRTRAVHPSQQEPRRQRIMRDAPLGDHCDMDIRAEGMWRKA